MSTFSEIRLVTVSVADLATASRFYRDSFGYEVLGAGDGSPAFLRAWQAPAGLTARFEVIGRPGSGTGLLRLVEFSRPGEPIRGDYSRYQDHGYYILNFRVPDLASAWPRLLANGATARSEPTFWEVTDEIGAWDSQCFDPSRILLDVYETRGREDVFPRLMSPANDLETVAIHVADAERSRRFYASLGFEPLFDRTIANMGAFFHLPDHVGMRDVNMLQAGRPHVGCIEIVQLIGCPGESLKERARPPNLGIFGISIETESLGEAECRIREHGLELIAGPLVTITPPFGRVHSFTCHGPDGEMLAFFQRYA
ncbi:MAG TPA: VOC family protein [Steroidobacteraceae bacterium]|nr:VOC family protein [Steroidobacteraceae bacterium]